MIGVEILNHIYAKKKDARARFKPMVDDMMSRRSFTTSINWLGTLTASSKTVPTAALMVVVFVVAPTAYGMTTSPDELPASDAKPTISSKKLRASSEKTAKATLKPLMSVDVSVNEVHEVPKSGQLPDPNEPNATHTLEAPTGAVTAADDGPPTPTEMSPEAKALAKALAKMWGRPDPTIGIPNAPATPEIAHTDPQSPPTVEDQKPADGTGSVPPPAIAKLPRSEQVAAAGSVAMAEPASPQAIADGEAQRPDRRPQAFIAPDDRSDPYRTPAKTQPGSPSAAEIDAITASYISALQRALPALGYNPGPQTGNLDPATAAAILAYQHAAGLPQDAETAEALHQTIDSVYYAAPPAASPPIYQLQHPAAAVPQGIAVAAIAAPYPPIYRPYPAPPPSAYPYARAPSGVVYVEAPMDWRSGWVHGRRAKAQLYAITPDASSYPYYRPGQRFRQPRPWSAY